LREQVRRDSIRLRLSLDCHFLYQPLRRQTADLQGVEPFRERGAKIRPLPGRFLQRANPVRPLRTPPPAEVEARPFRLQEAPERLDLERLEFRLRWNPPEGRPPAFPSGLSPEDLRVPGRCRLLRLARRDSRTRRSRRSHRCVLFHPAQPGAVALPRAWRGSRCDAGGRHRSGRATQSRSPWLLRAN
jgi:hypothetical protein